MALSIMRCSRCTRTYDRKEFKRMVRCAKCEGRRFEKASRLTLGEEIGFLLRHPYAIKDVILRRPING